MGVWDGLVADSDVQRVPFALHNPTPEGREMVLRSPLAAFSLDEGQPWRSSRLRKRERRRRRQEDGARNSSEIGVSEGVERGAWTTVDGWVVVAERGGREQSILVRDGLVLHHRMGALCEGKRPREAFVQLRCPPSHVSNDVVAQVLSVREDGCVYYIALATPFACRCEP